jgi:hypothetical protein
MQGLAKQPMRNGGVESIETVNLGFCFWCKRPCWWLAEFTTVVFVWTGPLIGDWRYWRGNRGESCDDLCWSYLLDGIFYIRRALYLCHTLSKCNRWYCGVRAHAMSLGCGLSLCTRDYGSPARPWLIRCLIADTRLAWQGHSNLFLQF